MDLLDSDIFVLDLRFPNDPRHAINRRLVESRQPGRATTIFNLLEVCGILSFNLSREALLALYGNFSQHYAVSVLFPPGTPDLSSLSAMISGTFEKITRKMSYGDAQILWVAEQHPGVDRLISWNAKDFIGRTHLQVITPQEWTEEMRAEERRL